MTSEAHRYMTVSAPRSAEAHLLETPRLHGDGAGGSSPECSVQHHVFIADGSQLFDADESLFSRFNAAFGDGSVASLLTSLGFSEKPRIDDTPLAPPPIHALSLAVAQKCNLGCTYCYAQQGEFGGTAKSMPEEVAMESVRLLISGAEPGAKLNLSFLGGEPLAGRAVIYAATRYASALAAERGCPISFSITTNGTLLTEADAEFFETFGFAVTISMDGPRETHNLLRPFRDGRGSFDVVLKRSQPLLALQRRMQVSARVTVTPQNPELRRTLDEFIGLGFHSVGFSPMLSSPNGKGEMQPRDLEAMLEQMLDCGREFERRTLLRQRYPFANMTNALREIERGTHRPYPCGAGAGYLGVSADGDLSACHRFVGDEAGAMGSLSEGIDLSRQTQWLTERHVHTQEPCSGCWARYLCGGGCHHEVIRRGRPACDYIRGWLHYCLEAYLRLSQANAVSPL